LTFENLMSEIEQEKKDRKRKKMAIGTPIASSESKPFVSIPVTIIRQSK